MSGGAKLVSAAPSSACGGGYLARVRPRAAAAACDHVCCVLRRPMNGAGANAGAAGNRARERADVDPIEIDTSVTWESVGGLEGHVQQLKEMVMLPLLYPEVFERFDLTPPSGVLFFGPPGTGKTLVARALANTCSVGGKRVSFFMRKGADCLSKWVGEAERQLRLLFEQAKRMQPSIIFFDEIDGLAPVRSQKQDQIHSSIVSTMLALMDGLDKRGQVVVIGATNRVDAIDPALRRPGRFDRELMFTLPNRVCSCARWCVCVRPLLTSSMCSLLPPIRRHDAPSLISTPRIGTRRCR